MHHPDVVKSKVIWDSFAFSGLQVMVAINLSSLNQIGHVDIA